MTAGMASSASAARTIGDGGGGGDDGGGGGSGGCGTNCPPPPPPPPPSFEYVAVNNGSIGGSALGADYQAALEVWTDSARQNYLARGYVWSDATLLGFRQNLVMLNGQVTAGTSFGTNVNAFVLGQQVLTFVPNDVQIGRAHV